MTPSTGTTTSVAIWWSSRSDRQQVKWALIFLSPWIIGFLVFTLGPMVWSLYLSFTEYDPFRGNPQFIGAENYENLMADPRARLALSNTIYFTIFNVPGTVIILFAALKNVPADMYEAARIDGANAWAQFRNITVPFISGPLFFVIVINVIASLQIFAEVWAMFQGRPSAGPSAQRASLMYVPYLFQKGFQDFQMGYASAMAWILFVIVLTITLVQLWLSKRWVYYEGQ